MIVATLLQILPNKVGSFDISVGLRFLGLPLTFFWLTKIERVMRKKISMIFAVAGQFLLWLATLPNSSNTYVQDIMYPLLIVVIIFWIIALLFAKIKRLGSYNGVERRNFSYITTREILKKQKNCCAICKINLTSKIIEYDHIDGDRSNNDNDNCRALCSNCHAKKTRTI